MQSVKGKLPILISVPHGGTMVPTNLQAKCLLSSRDILLDGDTWTRELYDFAGLVEEYIQADIARIVVDMNRSRDDLPPKNPDGVVKTIAVNGKKVWDQVGGVSKEELQRLMEEFHTPYHHRLVKAAQNPKVALAIDCHTMLDMGPSKGVSNWEKRPLFCIGNRGDVWGKQVDEPITAPTEMMIRFKEGLEREFSEYKDGCGDAPVVTMNKPFKGGYITTYHGNQGSIPWIQLEINRRLYLPCTDKISMVPDNASAEKMKDIRDRLYVVFAGVLGKN